MPLFKNGEFDMIDKIAMYKEAIYKRADQIDDMMRDSGFEGGKPKFLEMLREEARNSKGKEFKELRNYFGDIIENAKANPESASFADEMQNMFKQEAKRRNYIKFGTMAGIGGALGGIGAGIAKYRSNLNNPVKRFGKAGLVGGLGLLGAGAIHANNKMMEQNK